MRKTALAMLAGIFTLAAQPVQAQLRINAIAPSNPCTLKASMTTASEPTGRCAKAIDAAGNNTEKAKLYFYWAYSLNDVGNYDAALPNLDKAIALVPDFINGYYERAFTRALLGDYDTGYADADRAVQLAPGDPSMLRQRAIVGANLGRFASELADCDLGMARGDDDPMVQVCRAEALVGLGRYKEAKKALANVPGSVNDPRTEGLRGDVMRMLSYKPKGDFAARCDLSKVDQNADLDSIIADCSWAILNAKDVKQRVNFLTVRAFARTTADGSFWAGYMDFAQAAAAQPDNPYVHLNFGATLSAINFFQSARHEYAKVIASPGLKPDLKAEALGLRAQASLELEDPAAARADAEAAIALAPSPAAFTVLGDLAFEKDDAATAKRRWLEAWRAGYKGEDLRRKLRKVGVEDPDKEPVA